jgi:multiple sugar transport system ATP-binding protein
VKKIVTLQAGAHALRATVPVTVRVTAGETLRFGWNPGKVVMFDQTTGRSLRHGG